MAALVAAIHVFGAVSKAVGGRAMTWKKHKSSIRYLIGQPWAKPGHDDVAI
jgi:hypothetical protein